MLRYCYLPSHEQKSRDAPVPSRYNRASIGGVVDVDSVLGAGVGVGVGVGVWERKALPPEAIGMGGLVHSLHPSTHLHLPLSHVLTLNSLGGCSVRYGGTGTVVLPTVCSPVRFYGGGIACSALHIAQQVDIVATFNTCRGGPLQLLTLLCPLHQLSDCRTDCLSDSKRLATCAA